MAEIRYKVRLWSWDGENECYSVKAEIFADLDAAERSFNDYDVTSSLPLVQLIQEKIASGCVIDEATIKERSVLKNGVTMEQSKMEKTRKWCIRG